MDVADPGARGRAAVGPGNPRVTHAYPNGATAFQKLSGCVAASFFPLAYILAPLNVVLALLALLIAPFSWVTHALWAPLLASIACPPLPSNVLLQSWPFKYMPAYFNYTEIAEVDDAEVEELMQTKRVMFVGQPHGVFTFCGACAAVTWGSRFWRPEKCPTVSPTPSWPEIGRQGNGGVMDTETEGQGR